MQTCRRTYHHETGVQKLKLCLQRPVDVQQYIDVEIDGSRVIASPISEPWILRVLVDTVRVPTRSTMTPTTQAMTNGKPSGGCGNLWRSVRDNALVSMVVGVAHIARNHVLRQSAEDENAVVGAGLLGGPSVDVHKREEVRAVRESAIRVTLHHVANE